MNTSAFILYNYAVGHMSPLMSNPVLLQITVVVKNGELVRIDSSRPIIEPIARIPRL
jgi:hypothetical protein